VLAFFLFNAGLLALVKPVQVDEATRWFYVPVCAATVAATSIAMATRTVPRWLGGALVAIYVVFVGYGHVG
jgi:cation:H+ antiporter